MYSENIMKLLHEYSNKDGSKSALVYLTEGGEYIVVVQEIMEKVFQCIVYKPQKN